MGPFSALYLLEPSSVALMPFFSLFIYFFNPPGVLEGKILFTVFLQYCHFSSALIIYTYIKVRLNTEGSSAKAPSLVPCNALCVGGVLPPSLPSVCIVSQIKY